MGPLRQVRFKYLLGEVHLASWRPTLLALTGPPTDDGWPALDDVHLSLTSTGGEGLWCRRVSLGRFPIGRSRFGPWLCYVPRREILYEVDLEGSFESYLSRWSSKARYNIKRSVRNLVVRNQSPVLEVAHEPGHMRGFLREAAAISRTTYQSRLLQSGLNDDEETAVWMEQQAARRMARGYLLRDRGQAIAFAWCRGDGDRLVYEVIGYVEAVAELSPGSVLLYLIIEDMFALARFRFMDFGLGEAAYKRLFSTRHLEFADAYLLPPTFRNQVFVGAHWWTDRLSAGVGDFLERHGAKAFIKKLFRRIGART